MLAFFYFETGFCYAVPADLVFTMKSRLASDSDSSPAFPSQMPEQHPSSCFVVASPWTHSSFGSSLSSLAFEQVWGLIAVYSMFCRIQPQSHQILGFSLMGVFCFVLFFISSQTESPYLPLVCSDFLFFFFSFSDSLLVGLLFYPCMFLICWPVIAHCDPVFLWCQLQHLLFYLFKTSHRFS